MEARIMCPINFVSPINVSDNQKGVEALLHQIVLMSRRVGSQTVILVDVVRVRGSSELKFEI